MPRLLTGAELQLLFDGLDSAFDVPALTRLLLFRLEKRIANYGGTGQQEVFFNLVVAANMEGWWPELLAAARASRPGNPVLLDVEAKLLAPAVPAIADNLQKIVTARSLFQNVDEFAKAFSQIVDCICAVETTGGGRGTGWLVASDLVLTNYHVVKSFLDGAGTPKDLRCRFDFKVLDGATQAGRAVPLVDGAGWCVANRPYSASDSSATATVWGATELDYALLRLAENVGDGPIGQKPEVGAPKRGWITVPSQPPTVQQGDPMWVFQHPQDNTDPAHRKQLPMKLADGQVLGFAGNGMRLRHDARTLPGSSGSPCCNAQLVPVALHHAGDPRDWPDFHGQWNQAIPLGLIVADMKTQPEVPAFWDIKPAA